MDLNSIINSINGSVPENEWPQKPWSTIRSDYQRIAFDAHRTGNHDKAVLYDTKALSCGFIGTLLNDDQRKFFNNNRRSNVKIDDHSNKSQKTDHPLFDYLSKCTGDIMISEPKKTIDDNQFSDLCTKCAQLPKQWNVVQFSQLYNGYNGYAATKDIYTSDAPIKITLFCDSLSTKRDKWPINLILDFKEHGDKSVSLLI